MYWGKRGGEEVDTIVVKQQQLLVKQQQLSRRKHSAMSLCPPRITLAIIPSSDGTMDTTAVTACSPSSSCMAAIWHTSSVDIINSRSCTDCVKIQPTLRSPSSDATKSARRSSSVPRSSCRESAVPCCEACIWWRRPMKRVAVYDEPYLSQASSQHKQCHNTSSVTTRARYCDSTTHLTSRVTVPVVAQTQRRPARCCPHPLARTAPRPV